MSKVDYNKLKYVDDNEHIHKEGWVDEVKVEDMGLPKIRTEDENIDGGYTGASYVPTFYIVLELTPDENNYYGSKGWGPGYFSNRLLVDDYLFIPSIRQNEEVIYTARGMKYMDIMIIEGQRDFRLIPNENMCVYDHNCFITSENDTISIDIKPYKDRCYWDNYPTLGIAVNLTNKNEIRFRLLIEYHHYAFGGQAPFTNVWSFKYLMDKRDELDWIIVPVEKYINGSLKNNLRLLIKLKYKLKFKNKSGNVIREHKSDSYFSFNFPCVNIDKCEPTIYGIKNYKGGLYSFTNDQLSGLTMIVIELEELEVKAIIGPPTLASNGLDPNGKFNIERIV